MEITKKIIQAGLDLGKNPVIAISGGGDSLVLLDIIVKMGHRLPLVYADSQMEYPETLPFVTAVADSYGLRLHVTRAGRTPKEQWEKSGWPMLGKMAGRKWQQRNRDRDYKVNVTQCCRDMKIAPARRLTRRLGATLQFTGQRGAQDDQIRGMREFKDGAIKYVKNDRLLVASPLLGWTDTMIRRYTEQNDLPVHPAKQRGAQTIGCMFCGGGAQYDNSGFRILRQSNPEAWHEYIVEWEAGQIILSIKYDATRARTAKAIEQLGGLAALAEERPWVFDYLRPRPLQGYDRGAR